MKHKQSIFLFIFIVFLLAACSPSGDTELADATDLPLETREPVIETTEPVAVEKISVDHCAAASSDTHQLLYAAKGVCFLYPDNYDVFQGEDGGITLYVKSLLNTEAPLASLSFEPLNGRSLPEIVSVYLPDVDMTTALLQTIDFGGEKATVLDNLPGQDTNRRVIAIYNDIVYDLMVARVGVDYGAVGEEAETLYRTITDSFQFTGIEPVAPLLAGPECPEASAGTTLFTNAEDGFCLLLPDGYAVDDSITSNDGGGETAVYVDSLQDTAHARLFITVDDANGRSLEEITAEKEAEITGILGTAATWSFGYMLDGVPANQFDQVPGQDLSRQVVLVHNGRLYTLTFIPDDPALGAAYAEMQTLYETVMDSFSFLWQS